MSLRRNIIANYTSQIYVTAVGIVTIPIYIKYMGAEAYGLIGFFAILQAWFSLLDMGLTPTMARESARFNGGASTAIDYRRLARALEGVFAVTALLGGGLMFTLAGTIADKWLNANQLPRHELVGALKIIAIIIALRWMSGLYRGVVTGAEKMVWLSGFNSLIATGRFVLIIPILISIDSSPSFFFSFQLAIALIEFTSLAWMAYTLLPTVAKDQHIKLQWEPLKTVLKFSLSIALTSSAWIFVTQTDKLVLSKILPLSDYGYFTVAVLIAGSIMVISGPISSAIMPRMARLQAEGKHTELIDVYRQASRLATTLAIPAALILIFFASEVLWAWSGNAELVTKAHPALRLYAVGYAFLMISAFPYYLQYAKGNLRLHIIGSLLFVFFMVPSVLLATMTYGITGAGWAWLLCNAMYFIFWTLVVHIRIAPGLHQKWLLADIAKPIVLPIGLAMISKASFVLSSDRLILSMQLITNGLVLFAAAYLSAKKLNLNK